jgi:hypothetical protein
MSRNLRGRLERLERHGNPVASGESEYVYDWDALLRGDLPGPKPGQRIDWNWDQLINSTAGALDDETLPY